MNSSKEPSQPVYVCSFGNAPEWQPAYLTSEMYASLISISAVNLLVCPCSIFLNIFVMIAVKTSPRLRNNCNILLACLAGTDLMTSVFGMPLFVAEQIYRLTGSWENYSVCVLRFIRDANVRFSVPASTQPSGASQHRAVHRNNIHFQVPRNSHQTSPNRVGCLLVVSFRFRGSFDGFQLICSIFYYNTKHFHCNLLPNCRLS